MSFFIKLTDEKNVFSNVFLSRLLIEIRGDFCGDIPIHLEYLNC